MRTVCLVNFYRNINGLWETRYDGESCFLERYIKSKDINTYVYSEKDVTSVVDISEDILAFSDEAVVFITNNENLFLNLSLAKQIEEEEPDCSIILYCLEKINDEYVRYIKEDYIYISDDYERNICEAFDVDYDDTKTFLKECSQFDDDKDLRRFQEQIEILLGRKENGSIISRNLNAVLKDIDIVKNAYADKKASVKLIGIKLNEYEFKDDIWNAIKEKEENLIFEAVSDIDFLKLIGEDLPKNLLLFVSINKALVEDEDFGVIETYKNITSSILVEKELLNNISKNEKFIEYVQANKLETKIANEGNVYWRELDVNKLKCKSVSKKLDKEFQTFSTGFIFSNTGEYISVPLNGFVKHVKIDYQDINDDILTFLDEACSINSSILVTGNRPGDNSELYHLKDLKKMYKKEEWIEKIQEKLRANQNFPKNLIAIDNGVININGIENNIKLKFKEAPYSDFKNLYESEKFDKETNTNLTILSMDTEKDFSKFIEEVDEYYETKGISHSSLLHARMKNSCRFLSRNYCSLTKVPRVEIDNEGKVYPCYERVKPLGTVEDSIFDITQAAYVEHETKLRKNSCSKCKAAVGCPKCACMPGFMEKQYCSLMINKPYLTDFILESIVISNMRFTNKEVSNMPIENIKLSNEHMQNLLVNYEDGDEAQFFAKYVFMIVADSFYAIWSPNTNKVYKVSKEIAMIAEALLKKINPHKIIKIIADEANLNEENSEQLCKNVFELFYKNNLLYRPVQL